MCRRHGGRGLGPPRGAEGFWRFTIAVPTDGQDRSAAERRLQVTLSVLAESGIDASGLVVDGDVFTAVEKVRQDEEVHEIILATYPTGRSRWMADDVVDRLRKASGVGITRVVVLPEDARRPLEQPGVRRVAVIADDALGADGLIAALRERADRQALGEAFRMTGFFLDRSVYEPRGISPPEARAGFLGALARHFSRQNALDGNTAA